MQRPAAIWALTVLVVVFTFLYRFNALGGSLGGFDGDQFIYYLGAKQILLGERPLRDFADAGLQGAWPALTYELPALAQRVGGATLLSEAVFSVGMLALAAALLFRSAAALASPLAALTATALTIVSGTKLYGYSKVVVFSVAVALLLRYARRQKLDDVVLLAGWSAVAFLFRHDYLVYLAPVVALLMLTLTPTARQTGLRHLLLYGLVTGVLLVGPLYSIERYAGVRQYLVSAMNLSANEGRRTDLEWPVFHAAGGGAIEFFGDEDNARAALYYVCLAIPLLAAGALRARPVVPGLDVTRSRALILSLALLAFLLNYFLLRGNLSARFGDLGAPIAVLGAWLATFLARQPAPWNMVARAATLALVAIVTLSLATTGSVWQELDTTGLRDSAGKIGRRFVAVTSELRALPPNPTAADEAAVADVADYLRRCTRPDDRTLVVADSPEVSTFASRPFAAGQATFRPGFYTLDEDQRLMLARLEGQSVPVALTDEEDDYEENFAPGFPLIHAYLQEHYALAGELPALTGGPMRVFVRRGLTPTGTYGATGLPCFSARP
jgi:hypothetical protein